MKDKSAKNEWDNSIEGIVIGTLAKYYLKIFLPICLLTMFIEETTNLNAPRVDSYKVHWLNIPYQFDFLSFEVSRVDDNMKRSTDATNAIKSRKEKELANNLEIMEEEDNNELEYSDAVADDDLAM